MPLNIISNSAANTAHRNLMKSDMQASSSVAKLSSGTRVLTARDDAASLALGSRLRAEVAAIRAANVNAGQAASMLQIADGAMSQINDILVRLKALSIQAASAHLGAAERGLIDAEFQQLLQEIDRISGDTEFNGRVLLNGSGISELKTPFEPTLDGVSSLTFDSSVADGATFRYGYDSIEEILTISKLGADAVLDNRAQNIDGDDVTADGISFTFGPDAEKHVFSYQFDTATEQLTIVNESTGEQSSLNIESAFESAFGETTNLVGAADTLEFPIPDFDLSVIIQEGFDRTVNITAANVVDDATIDTNQANVNAATTVDFNRNATLLDGDGYAALTNLTNFDTATGELTITATVVSNAADQFTLGGLAGFAYDAGTAGDDSATITAAANTVLNFNGTAVGTLNLAGIDLAGATDGGTFDIVVSLEGIIVNDQAVVRTGDEILQIDLTEELDAAAGTGQNLSGDNELTIDVPQFGVTVTFDRGFDRASDLLTAPAVATSTLPPEVTNASFVENTGFLSPDVFNALLEVGFDAATGIGYNSVTGVLSLQVSDDTAGAGGAVTIDGLTGIDLGLGVGNKGFDQTGTASETVISVLTGAGDLVEVGTLTADYVNTGGIGPLGTIDIQLGKGVFYNNAEGTDDFVEFTFKIGTGNEDTDDIVLKLDAVNADTLGLGGQSVATLDQAEDAAIAITEAITSLQVARANTGALQNRLDLAASNLAVSQENIEAARSALLDLDVAQEITSFTSKQILVQAGVAMVAQANQLPQNLLQLFQ